MEQIAKNTNIPVNLWHGFKNPLSAALGCMKGVLRTWTQHLNALYTLKRQLGEIRYQKYHSISQGAQPSFYRLCSHI